MSENYHKFLQESEKVGFDQSLRKKIRYNISKYDASVKVGKRQFSDLELARRRAGFIKFRVLENLDKLINEFEVNFERNGGKILWAPSAEDAVNEIKNILKQNEVKLVIKSKSMITEELELNQELEKNGIEVVETDLGEYIVQIAGEKPYHIITPAMHKSKEEIAALFHEKFGTPINFEPEEITRFVRKHLREKFLNAGASITGANFLIADTGSIALTENEGNGVLSYSLPKIHIAIAGIEKIIPSLRDLDLFWPLLSTFGTGQNLTVYNSIISGPSRENEADGPQLLYLVLVDNGRTEVLKHREQRRALSCIRCGACLNACPVYKTIGGYTYNTTYTGPIGAVITPYLKGMKNYSHLSFASSLCGKCTEVCPVKINLHELLLINRNLYVSMGLAPTAEKRFQKISSKAFKNRKLLDLFGGKTKNKLAKIFLKKLWGPRRTLPVFAQKSFNRQWIEQRGQNP